MRYLKRDASGRAGGMGRLADEELMRLVAEIDSKAFEVIVERHGDVAFALAYRVCGTRAAAEDVTQEALLRVWRTAARYDSTRGSVRTWVLWIVRNQAIDALRASARRPQPASEEHDLSERIDEDARTDAQAVENAEGDRLRLALVQLPREQRQAIELAYFGGFTQTEIATMLEQPLGTIKGRLRLGLHRLRTHCQPAERQRS